MTPGETRAANPAVEAGETSPLDLLVVLGRRKRWLIAGPLAAAVVAAAVSLALPKSWTGTTRILPPQQGQSTAAALLNQLGGLAGAAGGALGIKNPSDLYIGMLKSASVADALIQRFDLKKSYREKLQVDARRALADASRFQSDKGGIITIEAEAGDPQLAADLANAYVEELHRLISSLAVTEAAQRRLFFEQQLRQTKDKLADAEIELRKAMEAGGLVSVDAQGRAAVETVARLRAEISAKEIQAGAMRAYATPSNPDMRRAEQELAAMRQELARLEGGAAPREAGRPGGEKAGGSAAGGTGMGNIRLVREVKYQEVMFELLARQYELARVDEAKDAPVIQVMDRAAPPERRSRPKRALIVIVVTLIAFFAAAAAALAAEALEAARADPARRGRLEALRAAWWRRG